MIHSLVEVSINLLLVVLAYFLGIGTMGAALWLFKKAEASPAQVGANLDRGASGRKSKVPKGQGGPKPPAHYFWEQN